MGEAIAEAALQALGFSILGLIAHVANWRHRLALYFVPITYLISLAVAGYAPYYMCTRPNFQCVSMDYACEVGAPIVFVLAVSACSIFFWFVGFLAGTGEPR